MAILCASAICAFVGCNGADLIVGFVKRSLQDHA
jgi:hypothetical protein